MPIYTRYDKLIRDKMPDLYQRNDIQFEAVIMNQDEYKQALLDKLVEEAVELRDAPYLHEQEEEMADVLELIFATIKALNIDPERVNAWRKHKIATRGGFEGRFKLLWSIKPDGYKHAESFPPELK
jgi:predicted house-cleaning noncanonical NTP pyrophosphatase (MazG superfamily)